MSGHQITRQNDVLLAPHPGVYLGPYPIRRQQKQNCLEMMLAYYMKLRTAVLKPRHRSDQSMLERVHANHKVIETMSDVRLDKWITDIKCRLHSKGLKEELICRAFATIKEVAKRELSMSHYDCQLQGGWIMMQGKIAEMQTGEGKTLTATLPAACAAMANMPVHVVTVNDYLVQRDAELMRPVYTRLGLTVGYIIEGMSDAERQQAYRCDITYCTGKQLVFDYLRDRMILKQFNSGLDMKLSSLYSSIPLQDKLLLRGLSFAVVDEVDSVLIDEARTPLILSCRSENNRQEELHREAMWLAKQLDDSFYYVADLKSKQVELTEQGLNYLNELIVNMTGIWRGERKSRILVQQALSALHCYKKDINYIVDEGKIVIIDENSGRSMPDRSWEAGLHQMIEEKEGCEQTGQNKTIARISYQRFFSRYLRLAGMTGTGLEVAGEIWRTYGLAVDKVPTHKPSRRRYDKTCIYYTHEEKWQAVVDEAIAQQAKNRPVLIGTRTVKDSEYISELLRLNNIEHQVLNAKNHKLEAEIISKAGHAGRVTVSTNMAGRGTDIKLDKQAAEAGGLHVICCERNDSSRVDRQLIGRCARQGDPGSYKVICSLEDDIVIRYFGRFTLMLLDRQNRRQLPQGKPVRPFWFADMLVSVSQKFIEYNHRQIRRSMQKVDEQRESMLAFTGEIE